VLPLVVFYTGIVLEDPTDAVVRVVLGRTETLASMNYRMMSQSRSNGCAGPAMRA